MITRAEIQSSKVFLNKTRKHLNKTRTDSNNVTNPRLNTMGELTKIANFLQWFVAQQNGYYSGTQKGLSLMIRTMIKN